MSYMIPPGTYKIGNVLYPNRYVCMSGNKDFVGHDVGDTVREHRYSNVLPVLINAHRSKSKSRTRSSILRLSMIL